MEAVSAGGTVKNPKKARAARQALAAAALAFSLTGKSFGLTDEKTFCVLNFPSGEAVVGNEEEENHIYGQYAHGEAQGLMGIHAVVVGDAA